MPVHNRKLNIQSKSRLITDTRKMHRKRSTLDLRITLCKTVSDFFFYHNALQSRLSYKAIQLKPFLQNAHTHRIGLSYGWKLKGLLLHSKKAWQNVDIKKAQNNKLAITFPAQSADVYKNTVSRALSVNGHTVSLSIVKLAYLLSGRYLKFRVG